MDYIGTVVTSPINRGGSPEAQRAVDGMEAFFSFLLASIGAAVCIALITAALIHLFRPLLVRWVQSMMLVRWLDRQSKDHQFVVPRWLLDLARRYGFPEAGTEANRLQVDFTETGRIRSGVKGGLTVTPGLRDELFMHTIQVEAKSAVSRPMTNPQLFMVVTAGAPAEAKGAVAFFDRIASEHPEIAAKMAATEPKTGKSAQTSSAPVPDTAFDAAMQAAEAILASTADRSLDKLQLSLITTAVWPFRLLALVVGIFIAFAGMAALGLSTAPTYLAVGVAGGLLSLFVSDSVTALSRRAAR